MLARVGEILGSGLQRQDTLHRIAELLAPGLATWCVFDIADLEGHLVQRVGVPSDVPLAPDAPHGPAIVMRTGEPELVADAERFGLRSMLCVPLAAGASTLGALTLLSADQRYGTFELELAGEIARRIATAIQVQRSEERYKMLFEASPMPMWVYDASTLFFLAVNDAAVRHYGYQRREFLRMRITDIRPPEDVPAVLDDVKSRGGPGSPSPRVWRHLRKDGSPISVEITAGRITFEGRKAALVLAHDVTDRLRLEQRLAEAEKMEAIGRLAGGVAHDFNNLLTVIAGYAEILQARQGGEESAEISRAAAQAAALTHQLLAFSRRQVLHPRLIDLNDIVSGMETMLQRIIGENISVGIRLDPALAAVEADRAQLERVILNLAANARDAMPNGGVLTIETSNVDVDEAQVTTHADGSPGPHVLLAVSDTGVGMDEDVAKHLFEPFFTTKPAGAGTGLGLATVFGVVKQSGGGIYVYSEPDRGSTFKIYLPAASAPAEVVVEAGADGHAGRGSETVMVVEDDEGVRELVRLMLEANGYEVLTVADAEEAVALCGARAIDLLLTDVVMPDVSGSELAQRLAVLAPEMRVLFMSGYSDEAVVRHGELSESAAFLEKPFTEKALARKVRDVLDAGPR
ncbi:response regulator [Solirubrobacter soli]|uniref:response regulator n=1 Tax=Solirubrobacter soli TaxID=363832 RepID=UPI0003FDAC1E|nr:response regulator [Solirubrobacter soli]